MKIVTVAAWAAACLSVASAGWAATPTDYLRGLAILDPELSPDGMQLAYLTEAGPQNHIIVQTIDDRKPVADINVGDQKITAIQWATKDYLLIFSASDDPTPGAVIDHRVRTYGRAFNLKTRKMVDISMRVISAYNNVASHAAVRRESNGVKGMFESQYLPLGDYISVAALFDVDLETGAAKLIDKARVSSGHWQVDAQGRMLAKVDAGSEPDTWVLQVRQNEAWRTVATRKGNAPILLGLDAGGRPLVRFWKGDDAGIKRIDPNGEIVDLLPSEDYGQDDADDEDQKLIWIVIPRNDGFEYRFLEKSGQARWQGVLAAYPGQSPWLLSSSHDGSRMIVRINPPNETPYLAFVDIKTGRARVLGDLFVGLAANDIAPQAAFNWSSEDGQQFEGVLTKARGLKPGQKAPLIVQLPSAGQTVPHLEFNGTAQAYAAAGYSYFQASQRGTGVEVQGAYGEKGLGDVIAGVRALVRAGEVDPNRICLRGVSSLPAYAAMSLIISDPELFRCAVIEDGGLFDLRARYSKDSSTRSVAFLAKTFDLAEVNVATTTAISPFRNASAVKRPVLFIHPAVVKFDDVLEARDFARAIQRAGGKAKLVELPGNVEARTSLEGRVKRIEAELDFLHEAIP